MFQYSISSFLKTPRKTTNFVVKLSEKSSGSLKSETFRRSGEGLSVPLFRSYFRPEKGNG